MVSGSLASALSQTDAWASRRKALAECQTASASPMILWVVDSSCSSLTARPGTFCPASFMAVPRLALAMANATVANPDANSKVVGMP